MKKFLHCFIVFVITLIGCSVEQPTAVVEDAEVAQSAVCSCGDGLPIPAGTDPCYFTCRQATCYPANIPWAEGILFFNFTTGLQECRQHVDGDWCQNDFKCLPGLTCVPYYDQGNGEGACNCSCVEGQLCGASLYNWLGQPTADACVSYCATLSCWIPGNTIKCVREHANRREYRCVP